MNIKGFYQCPECSFRYEDKEWAKKCEAWCKKHKNCNLDIVSHAEHLSDSQLEEVGGGENNSKKN
ncbi:MAG: hypothetical protein AAB565_02315 [Patescibacteria group bacterium]